MRIAVEGNIGASKSTLLELFKAEYGDAVEILPEPVAIWQNFRGHNVLEAFYQNPAKYAFLFQGLALLTRIEAQRTQQVAPIRLIERSGLSDWCFAKNCLDNGNMTQLEFDVYNGWFDLAQSIIQKPDLVIYLRTSPEVCYQRVRSRTRDEEASLPLEYLQQLHALHDERFLHTAVVIDRDDDILTDEAAKKQLLLEVKRAIEQASV